MRLMRVMGVDPGYGRLGVGVVETGRQGERLIFSACATTSPKLTFPERLVSLSREFSSWCRRFRPDWLALESLFFSANQKTAIRVAAVSGLLLYLAECRGLSIIELNPLEVKILISGYGRAKKSQLAAMVKRLLKLKEKTVRHDDEFDALAIALAAAAKLRHKFIHRELTGAVAK